MAVEIAKLINLMEKMKLWKYLKKFRNPIYSTGTDGRQPLSSNGDEVTTHHGQRNQDIPNYPYLREPSGPQKSLIKGFESGP